MRMCYTLGGYFFADRTVPRDAQVSLLFPEDGVLILNGEHRYSCREGLVSLPVSALAEGENLLFFRTAYRAYPCEGLRRTGETVAPCGLPRDEWLTDLLLRTEALADRVRRVEERLAALETDRAPKLFAR